MGPPETETGYSFALFRHHVPLQIEISRSYGVVEWREDLKRLCRRAGADGKASVLLFSDTQIKAETFVEDINNLLNTGMCPWGVYHRLGSGGICHMALKTPPSFAPFPSFVPSPLRTGEVPNMFPSDERAAINEQVRVEAKKAGKILDTPQVGDLCAMVNP